ncbi:MAG: hypothetical protein EOP85_05410, partial [Verrucomicrobiaceae bacterium]
MTVPRPSKRVTWLVIPIVPVVLMGGLIWLTGQPDGVDLSTRGSKPPPERQFSLANPGSWSGATRAGEWLEDGMDSLMEWEYNPWRRHGSRYPDSLGGRLRELEDSDRPEDKAEVERLKKMGREWFERMRERFPELALTGDKEIPREDNGLLQWTELVKRLREGKKDSLFDKPMSSGMEDGFRKRTPQNPESVKEWVAANRERIDEIRAIGLLPGQ